MSYNETNSFLFGLNHFTSPPTGQDQGAQAGGSNNMLDGLDAFGGPAPGHQPNGNELLENGSFAEQLSLWTNANFSFDGPTGHALMGEEDKKDDKDKDDDDEANRRAGKRNRNGRRNSNDNDAPPRVPNVGRRNGKDRLREENDALSQPPTPMENSNPSHQPSVAPSPNQGFPGLPAGLPNGHANNETRPASSSSGFPNQPNGAFPYNSAVPPPSTGAPLDLTSLLALQQLLSHNPLAIASLASFGALNPQLGALGNNLSAPILQQLQQQIHQQQQQQQQQAQNGANLAAQRPLQPPAPFPAHGAAPSAMPPQGQFAGWGFPTGMPPYTNGHAAPFGAVPHGVPAPSTASNPQPNGGGSVSDDSQNGGHSSNEDSKHSKKLSAEERADQAARRAAERDNIPPLKLIDTGNPEADAEANRAAIEEDKRRRNTAASARFRMKKKQREAALESHTKELQDQMDELRQANERLQKENEWLKGLIQVRSSEAGPSVESSTAGKERPSAVETLQAAQQLQALQHAVSSQQAAQRQLQSHTDTAHLSSPGTSKDRQRDTGLHPRGVGTDRKSTDELASAGQKRDRPE